MNAKGDSTCLNPFDLSSWNFNQTDYSLSKHISYNAKIESCPLPLPESGMYRDVSYDMPVNELDPTSSISTSDIDSISTSTTMTSCDNTEADLPLEILEMLESPVASPLTRNAANISSEVIIPEQWIPEDILSIGYRATDGAWKCGYPFCASTSTFTRACDLRKHFNTHQKRHFCEEPICQSTGVGFATMKDYKRHRRSHEPQIMCEAPGCRRKFSRKGELSIER